MTPIITFAFYSPLGPRFIEEYVALAGHGGDSAY
jgi:hypothetical protein